MLINNLLNPISPKPGIVTLFSTWNKFPLVEMCFWHKSQTVCISMGSNDYKILWNIKIGLCFDWNGLSYDLIDWFHLNRIDSSSIYYVYQTIYSKLILSVQTSSIYLISIYLPMICLFDSSYEIKHHSYETYIRKHKTKTYTTPWNHHTN